MKNLTYKTDATQQLMYLTAEFTGEDSNHILPLH